MGFLRIWFATLDVRRIALFQHRRLGVDHRGALASPLLFGVSRASLGRRRFLSAMKARSLVFPLARWYVQNECKFSAREPDWKQRRTKFRAFVNGMMRGSLSRAAVLTQVH